MISDDALDTPGLIAAVAPARVSERQLVRLRDAGCLPHPKPEGGGRGQPPRWLYPAGTVDQLRAILELRRQGMRSFDALRAALWVAGYPIELTRADLVASLPKAIDATQDEVEAAARELGANPGLLGPVAALFDGRAAIDWPALAWELAQSAVDEQPEGAETPELARLLGGALDLPAFAEVRDALVSASTSEIEEARTTLRHLLALAQQAIGLQRISGIGGKTDRGIRAVAGRGVERTLAAAPLLASVLRREPGMLSVLVGALVAYKRRGASEFPEVQPSPFGPDWEEFVELYRAEIPALAPYLTKARLGRQLRDGIAAEKGDTAARARHDAFNAELSAAVQAHRAEVEAFAQRHPELWETVANTRPTTT